ncbi:MAG: hypothetical protein SVG88_08880 [Halobacteriales archaeon]|nr:hypothetical protein [Halobacteriales archaeon]
MSHVLSGRLCARPCPELEVSIENALIRLYRPDPDADVSRRVAARNRDTFRILSEDEVEAKADRELTDPNNEVRTDEDGEFEATLADDVNYDGGPIQIDVRITSLDGHEVTPTQATITTIQSAWGTEKGDELARWDECLTQQQWCAILEAAGCWLVAGRITDCESEEPLQGLTVTVRDTDIVQDDELGSDTTNADGEYLIYYTEADLERVPSPFSPIELIGGPDLFFRIESSSGTPLLDEDRSRGRDPGRENVGRCHCENLCVDFEGDGDRPLFTHVGRFNIFQDIDQDGTLNKARGGLGGDGWGFFRHINLVGFVPETHPTSGKQMWYRFLYEDSNNNEHPLIGDLVDRLRVGIQRVGSGPGPGTFGFREVYVAGQQFSANPSLMLPPKILVPRSGSSNPVENGWVEVPGVHGNGIGHGPLMQFDTTAAVPGGQPPSATPGNTPTNQPTGEEITVIFETTVDDGSGNPSTASSDITRQKETVPLYVNNWAEVRALDVVDQNNNPIGCDTTNTAIVRYTADHEFLLSYDVNLNSPAAGGGSVWPQDLASGTVNRAGATIGANRSQTGRIDLGATYTGSGNYDAFADWPTCSYIARLQTRLALTNGGRPDDTDTTPAVDGVFYKT